MNKCSDYNCSCRTNDGYCQLTACYKYKTETIIIPDSVREEKGDLISREALKKEYLKYKPYAVDFLSLIDNAPTVENIIIFCENADEKTIEELKAEMQKVKLAVFEERPQGKWIKKQVTPASCTYVCSECGIEEVILGNFCCWCGADMRKGGTE